MTTKPINDQLLDYIAQVQDLIPPGETLSSLEGDNNLDAGQIYHVDNDSISCHHISCGIMNVRVTTWQIVEKVLIERIYELVVGGDGNILHKISEEPI